MITCLGKSCSFSLPRVPFVNCCQFMYLVISLLVLRAGIVSVPDHCLSYYFVNSSHLCICCQLKEQSHEIVRLPNRTICEKSCRCKTSLQFYLRFVGVVFAFLISRTGSIK